MAAPSCHAKLDKKINKKLFKIKRNLSENENLEISDTPTKILCVQNGGLDNNVSQEDLQVLLSTIGRVEGIIMVQRKPYCFACFADVEDALRALKSLNGHLLRKGKDPSQDVVLYFLFVKKAPPNVMPSDEVPPGLHVLKDFIDQELEEKLLNLVNMDEENVENESCGSMKHRKVKHYGFEFKYDINDVDINEPLPQKIPELCDSLLEKARVLGLINYQPDQLTVNQYKPGHGIPPHVDTPPAFEDGILSLSLGSQAVMDFRHPDGRHLTVLLPRRSVVAMTGESRYIWSHGITPRKSDIVPSPDGQGLTLQHRDIRTSFTFRKVVMNRESSSNSKNVNSWKIPDTDVEAVALEKEHVHKVYDDIADHFSGTRYKPWPRVVDFLMEQPALSLLADVGCGNGKCLGVNQELFQIGSDYSSNLANICHSRGFETLVADVTCLPFKSDTFDVVLCIAVIHHMATKERRHQAVSEIIRVLYRGGKALIYVWAIEQDHNKTQSKYIKSSRERQLNLDQTHLVESTKENKTDNNNTNEKSSTANICASSDCSLSNTNTNVDTLSSSDVEKSTAEVKPIASRRKTKDNEIGEDMKMEGSSPNECCSDESCPPLAHSGARKTLQVHVNRTSFKEQDMLVPWQLKMKDQSLENTNDQPGDCPTVSTPKLFHRYYHLFRQGEIETVCKRVPNCAILKSYYDQGNWCVILEKR